MSRLLVHVEGITEETFVKDVLAPHLMHYGYSKVSARLVGNARLRSRRGGIRSWLAVRNEICNHLKEDTGCLATTMVDYYALPSSGPSAWPGRAEAGNSPFALRADIIERALLDDICEELGGGFNPKRFIPYVIIHEFEGLLFSDCVRFAKGIEKPELSDRFQEIRDLFDTPEEINDTPETAPSARVQALVPEYEKPLYGTLAILEIGLTRIRAECPCFRRWLDRLETRLTLL